MHLARPVSLAYHLHVERLLRIARRVVRRPDHLPRALALVVAIRCALRTIALPRLVQLLGRLADHTRVERPGTIDERFVWAVSAVTGTILPGRGCLTAALAVWMHARQRGAPATLRIGVARPASGGLRAHAWVESAGRIVVGGPAALVAQYAPLEGWERLELDAFLQHPARG